MRHNIKFIFWGSIAALGALIAEVILSALFPTETLVLVKQITVLLFLLVVVEELFKLSFIFRAVSESSFLKQSFFISVGFALTEIFLAYFKNVGSFSADLFLLLIGIGLLHLATGVLSGFSAFIYKQTKRLTVPSLLFFLAIALHLIYNVAIIKLIKN